MSRGTNALFWIICGAIFVISVYLIVKTDLGSNIQELFTDTNNIVTTTDNGATPAKPVYKSQNVRKEDFSLEFYKAANASRYRCNYGTEKTKLNNTGIIYINKDTITCAVSHLSPNTKYYVQVVAQNSDKATNSDLRTVTTKN